MTNINEIAQQVAEILSKQDTNNFKTHNKKSNLDYDFDRLVCKFFNKNKKEVVEFLKTNGDMVLNSLSEAYNRGFDDGCKSIESKNISKQTNSDNDSKNDNKISNDKPYKYKKYYIKHPNDINDFLKEFFNDEIFFNFFNK